MDAEGGDGSRTIIAMPYRRKSGSREPLGSRWRITAPPRMRPALWKPHRSTTPKARMPWRLSPRRVKSRRFRRNITRAI